MNSDQPSLDAPVQHSIWTQPIRFRFSLRTLMLLTAVVAIGTAWITWRMRDHRERLVEQAANQRWWSQFAGPQVRDMPDASTERKKALARWPQLTELEAADIHVDCQDGKVVALNFVTRPGTNDENVSYYLDNFAAELASLTTLSLENSQVSDRVIDRLESLPLVELWLDNCAGITDTAVENLSQMQSLTCLRIPGTSITAEGAEKLRASLPHCLIIEGEREPLPQ